MVNIRSFSAFDRTSYQSRSFSAVTGAGGSPSIRMVPKSLIQRPYTGSRSSRKGPSATRSPTMFRTGCSLPGGLLPVSTFGLLLPVLHARCPLLAVQRRLLVPGEQEAHADAGPAPPPAPSYRPAPPEPPCSPSSGVFSFVASRRLTKTKGSNRVTYA